MLRRTFLATPAAAFAASKASVFIFDPEVRDELAFPPTGRAYRENAVAHRIWRRILIQSPDLVIIVGDRDGGLEAALQSRSIPVRRAKTRALAERMRTVRLPKSTVHIAAESWQALPPREVATQLSAYFGREMKDPVYIQTVALWARLRLGHTEDVQRLAEPFLSGAQNSLAKPTASHYSGHLLFGELAEATRDARATARVVAAADAASANPLDNEMSDSVFMVCPILAKAGKLTGEGKYFDRAAAHFRRMQTLCLRKDGLYRHSPLCEAAWGRGNAFPILGLSLMLSDFDARHTDTPSLRQAYRELAAVLSRFQLSDGMWRQVVDYESAYSEFSATAMIGEP